MGQENPREIVAFLPAVKPSWFFAVPRIFEKLKAGLEGHLSTQGEQTVGWLVAARRKVELEQAGEAVPEDVAATAAEGEEKLFAGLRAARSGRRRWASRCGWRTTASCSCAATS